MFVIFDDQNKEIKVFERAFWKDETQYEKPKVCEIRISNCDGVVFDGLRLAVIRR